MSEGGYRRKIETIRAADFDDDELLGIMFGLGPDAERLSIDADSPDLRSN
jgi:hypothetical protein